MAYYYLTSQLPYPIYGSPPPMSAAAFRDLAKSLLDSGDVALLDLVDLDPGDDQSTGCDFIDNWRGWERTLRLNLARQRAQKIKQEGSAPVDPPAFPVDAVAAAVKAMGVESPLEAEFVLDKARWDAIEVLQGGDYFDRSTVFAYLLKLMLLERHQAFNEGKGFFEYKSLYASILGSVQPGSSPVGEIK